MTSVMLFLPGCFMITRSANTLTEKYSVPDEILHMKINENGDLVVFAEIYNKGSLIGDRYAYFSVSRHQYSKTHSARFPLDKDSFIDEKAFSVFKGSDINFQKSHGWWSIIDKNNTKIKLYPSRYKHGTSATGSIVFGVVLLPSIVLDIVTGPIQVYMFVSAWRWN